MFIALSSLFFGTRVILSGLSSPNVVLPPQDRKLLEDLIRDGNEKGIDQYVRLSSLSGTTGAATKLGLTGLPLATAGLTIFFSALAILGINGFLDLTKLTLGAFIGSFVQRNLSDDRHDGLKQERLLTSAIGLVEEGACLYGALRMRASTRVAARGNYPHAAGTPEETLKEDVRSLLNEVEAQSAYFERVNAAKKRIQQKFNVPDFPALSEIFQIRRDFWAASEIFLMEGIQELGPKLGDAQSCETLKAEARALLFKEGAALPANARDFVELRLAVAREEAVAFQAEAARAVAAELEKEPPSFSCRDNCRSLESRQSRVSRAQRSRRNRLEPGVGHDPKRAEGRGGRIAPSADRHA